MDAKVIKREVYLDNAAATPMDSAVIEAMNPYFSDISANPSALYLPALNARAGVEQARAQAATFLGTTSDTIVFTSGGTESINLAIFGTAYAHQAHGKHIITTKVEHKAVLNCMKQLETEEFEVTYLDVDETGQIDLKELKKAIRPDTILISIMYANNEIGTIYPIQEIGKLMLKLRKQTESIYPLFHTDACQATNYLPMKVLALHVDLLSLNGSKMYGPKGAGLLFRRRDLELQPRQLGGRQEFGLRAGTEDVPSIVGLGKALVLVNQEENAVKMRELRAYFWKKLQKAVPETILNGPEKERLPNNLHVSFTGAEAESIILYLSARGVYCSAGSACTTESEGYSHVLAACGFDCDRMKGSIRFSLGKHTTTDDIDYVVTQIQEVIPMIRKMNTDV